MAFIFQPFSPSSFIDDGTLSNRHAGVGTTSSAIGEDGILDIDTTISLETTWHAMENLVSMGLVRSIGIRCLETSVTMLYIFFGYVGDSMKKPLCRKCITHYIVTYLHESL